MRFERARTVADAVLMEGYALYPYRASAPKNQFRWTFGVLAPRAWSEAGGAEAWWLQAQVLVAGAPRAIAVQLRFFQIERRRVEDRVGRPLPAREHDGRLAVSWDEGVVRTVEIEITDVDRDVPFVFAGSHDVEPHGDGRIVRERHAIYGRLRVLRVAVPAEQPLTRITVAVENTTWCDDLAATREAILTSSLASTHVAIAVDGGEPLSALDPPAWARTATAACASVRTYPVLIDDGLVLCAPFILYDRPQIAPESHADLCDASEIDELLLLRTRNLTDDEKRHARATDPRAAAIVDRADAMSDRELARLHGTPRDVRAGEMIPRAAVAIGSKVRLGRPRRTTDAQDLLFAGHVATVAEIREDVDGTTYLAVTIDDDPAADLHDWYGRYRYYRPDEVELL
jgi:hypothetical protein